jgi:hypothetical protein
LSENSNCAGRASQGGFSSPRPQTNALAPDEAVGAAAELVVDIAMTTTPVNIAIAKRATNRLMTLPATGTIETDADLPGERIRGFAGMRAGTT